MTRSSCLAPRNDNIDWEHHDEEIDRENKNIEEIAKPICRKNDNANKWFLNSQVFLDSTRF